MIQDPLIVRVVNLGIFFKILIHSFILACASTLQWWSQSSGIDVGSCMWQHQAREQGQAQTVAMSADTAEFYSSQELHFHRLMCCGSLECLSVS